MAAVGRCAWLEGRRQPYVLALASNDGVDLPRGRTHYHLPVEEIARHAVAPAQWQRCSAGAGAKRPRLFDWALVRLLPQQQPSFEQALLIRRPLEAPEDPKKLAYYLTLPDVRRPVYRQVVRILAPPEAVLRWSRWRPPAPGTRPAQPLPPPLGSTSAAVVPNSLSAND